MASPSPMEPRPSQEQEASPPLVHPPGSLRGWARVAGRFALVLVYVVAIVLGTLWVLGWLLEI